MKFFRFRINKCNILINFDFSENQEYSKYLLISIHNLNLIEIGIACVYNNIYRW